MSTTTKRIAWPTATGGAVSALLALTLGLAACTGEADPNAPEDELATTRASLGAAGGTVAIFPGPGGAAGQGGAGGTGGGASAGGAPLPPRPTPLVTLGQPRHGDSLYDSAKVTSPWYDPATKTITVTGSLSGVPKAWLNAKRVAVIVDGKYGTSTTWDSSSNTAAFTGHTPVADDPTWVQRGTMVELVDLDTNTVLARDAHVYYDLRMTPTATTAADAKKSIQGMAAQLTDYGVGNDPLRKEPTALEIPNLSSLPLPDLATLNAALSAAAAKLPLVQNPTGHVCIDFSDALDLQPLLKDHLAAYAAASGAYTQALADYATYQSLQNTDVTCSSLSTALGAAFPPLLLTDLACQLAVGDLCVQHVPAPDDFELCVDRLDGKATSLGIGSVADVDLAFAETPAKETGARLDADVTLAGVDGSLDAFLRNITVRWKQKKSCILRPEAKEPQSDVDSKPWLTEFTTCHDLRVKADRASTTVTKQPAQFSVVPGSNPELADVTQVQDGVIGLDKPWVDTKKDICKQDFLAGAAQAMATGFQAPFKSILNGVWNDETPRTQHARALQLLLGTFDLGALAHADHEIDAPLGVPLSRPLAGTQLTWSTQVSPLDAMVKQRQSLGYFYLPPGVVPPFALDALDPLGQPMDFSFTVTTNYLNQIVHARAATDHLWFDYQPNWTNLEFLGVTPQQTGLPADVDPPLNGAVLGRLFPMFNGLGDHTVQIHIHPTLDPLVWMNPDPPPDHYDPVTGAQLAYGIGALDIRFAEPNTTDPATGAVIPGKEWLHARLGFVDPNFSVALPDNRSPVLAAAYTDDTWGVQVMSNAFASCPMVPHGTLQPKTSCERDLETFLVSFLRPRLSDEHLALLSEIPSPDIWDAAGAARHPVLTNATTRYQWSQNITLYGAIGK